MAPTCRRLLPATLPIVVAVVLAATLSAMACVVPAGAMIVPPPPSSRPCEAVCVAEAGDCVAGVPWGAHFGRAAKVNVCLRAYEACVARECVGL